MIIPCLALTNYVSERILRYSNFIVVSDDQKKVLKLEREIGKLPQVELPIEHFGEGFRPVEFAGAFGPEAFGILLGAPVERLVFREAFYGRVIGELRARRKLPPLAQHGLDIEAGFVRGHVNPLARYARPRASRALRLK